MSSPPTSLTVHDLSQIFPKSFGKMFHVEALRVVRIIAARMFESRYRKLPISVVIFSERIVMEFHFTISVRYWEL